MKINGSSPPYTRPFSSFGRTSTSLFSSQQPTFGPSVSPSSGPSIWSAIQRIQSILLDRQDRAASGSNTSSDGSNVYAENKSITGNAVSGAKVGGKFLDVKAASMQYVQSTATDSKFTSKTIYSSSFEGDRTSITADRVQYAQINGDKSVVNAKTMTGGQIGGDGVTINAESVDGLLQVSGSGAKITAGQLSYTQINGKGASLTADKLGGVVINADDVSISAETAGSITLRGGKNSVTVDKATDIQAGAGNNSIKAKIVSSVSLAGGDDNIIVGTALGAINAGAGNDHISVEKAASVSGGKGNDTLTVGAGVQRVTFNAGDGADIVNAEKGTTIAFGAGLKRDDVQITRDGDTYRISFANSSDRITLNAGAGTTSKLAFADGSTLELSRETIEA
jgi:hypothetical protein